MDKFDRGILMALQDDATIRVADLAASIGMSTSPCWRRIRALRKVGIIRRQVVLCNRTKLGYNLCAFVMIRVLQHSDEWTRLFIGRLLNIPEVVEIYRMAGDIDYIFKVVMTSMEDYNRVYRQLINDLQYADIKSTFVMESIRESTALPLRDGS